MPEIRLRGEQAELCDEGLNGEVVIESRSIGRDRG